MHGVLYNMVEKILNINIDDENSAKIAEILGNKTCKRILGLIAEKEGLSETDISRELKIPANTVNYNIKKLINTGFIEATRDFFWSVKGKKIKTYKLANKKIIISTKKTFKNMLATIFGVGILGFIIKLVSNVYSTKAASASIDAAEKAGNLLANAPQTTGIAETSNTTLISTSTSVVSSVSVLQNTLMWFMLGCVAGLVMYLVYSKLVKGGKNIIN